MWPTWLNYLISNTRRCCTQSGTFAFSLFVQIRERGDVVKWQLSPHFSSVFHLRRGEKTDKQVVSSSVSYFSFLQLTAPKSQVWLELDSSLYQVTQHPPSLHSSISTWPTQPLFPFISLRAGFISGCPSVSELRCNQSPCPPLYSACSLSLSQTDSTGIVMVPFPLHNCSLPLPSSAFSQSPFFPLRQQNAISVFV